MSENQTMCSGEDLVGVQVAMTTCTMPSSGITIGLASGPWMKSGPGKRVLVKFSDANDWSRISKAVHELRAPEEKLVELSTGGRGGCPSSRFRLRP